MSEHRVEPSEAPVVRLHLRSTLDVDHGAIEDYCIRPDEEGWAGVGWGCWDDTPSGISWDDYVERKRRQGETVNESVSRLHELPVGALVWTRRQRGSSYWLGEIIGGWEYRGDDEARKLDMFNLRRCRWQLVGTEDAVPGKVVNNFRASKTLNPVSDRSAARYSRRLHAQWSGVQQSWILSAHTRCSSLC